MTTITERESPEAASDGLMAAIDLYLADEPTDIDEALRAVRITLSGRASQDQVDEIEVATRRLIGEFEQAAASTLGRENAALTTRTHPIRYLLDRALTDFQDADALDAAERELDDVESEYRTQLKALEDAVRTGDVPRLMQLRGDVEVALPGRIGAARLRVLELQIARAQAQTAIPERRAADAEDAVSDARRNLQDAHERLARAKAELGTAQRAEADATAARDQARRLVAELSRQRDVLASTHESDQQERLRRLAGLTGPADAPSQGAPRP